MEDSIYTTIIQMLGGIPSDEPAFLNDICPLINSALKRLYELGVGPKDKPYRISTGTEKWTDFMSDVEMFEDVKEFIWLNVKLLWDTPTSGFVTTSIQERINKLEWLLCTFAESERIDIFHEGMIYNVGDTVIKDGVHYVRIAPQSVPEKWDFRKWKVYDYQDETVPAYDNTINYVVGNRVVYDNKYYVCIINSPAGAFNSDKWVEYKP